MTEEIKPKEKELVKKDTNGMRISGSRREAQIVRQNLQKQQQKGK